MDHWKFGDWFPTEMWRPKNEDSIDSLIRYFRQSLVVFKKTNHVYPYGISQYPVKIMFPYFTHRQWPLNPDLQDTKPIRIAFALGNLAPQRANWFTGHGMLRKGWKMQKKNMVNRADLGSAVPTLLELRHRHGHHLASDNICRRHCPQSTPCSWRSLKPESRGDHCRMIQDCLPDMEKIVVFPSSFHPLEIDIWTNQEEISNKSLTPQTSDSAGFCWIPNSPNGMIISEALTTHHAPGLRQKWWTSIAIYVPWCWNI